MRTYDRILPYILASRQDVIRRQRKQQRECLIGIINCQLEIAVEFLNEALSRMERKKNEMVYGSYIWSINSRCD